MKRLILLASAAVLAACGQPDADTFGDADDVPVSARQDAEVRVSDDRMERMDRAMMEREFDVMNSSGRNIGTVMIKDTDDGVDVMLDVSSIPAGTHAIHFHETGTCDGPSFQSAGGHYNPNKVNHGFEAANPNPHPGDMRNFDAPQSGMVKTTLENDRVTLSTRPNLAPLFDGNGTALIIHAKADDYESQPSGAAGDRIACAVIAL